MLQHISGDVRFDPVTMASTTLLLPFVAIVATVVPARRALRVDPAVTLRAE